MLKPTSCVQAPDVDVLEMLLMVKIKKKYMCILCYVIGFITHVNICFGGKNLKRNTVQEPQFLSRDLRLFDDGGGKCSRGGKERSDQYYKQEALLRTSPY